MNHFVPDFDTDDDYVNVVTSNTSSSLNLPRKHITRQDDDLMELLWQNGQVVLQNQRLNNNNTKKPSSSSPPPPPNPSSMQQQHPSDQNLFIQEDEMTSWLHYPLREDDFCSDLLFSSATPSAPSAPATSEKHTATQITVARPPVPTVRRTEIEARPPLPTSVRPPVRNFMNFRGNFTGRAEAGPSIVRETTQVNQSSAASNSGLTRRTDETESRGTAANGGSSFAIPGLNHRKGKAVAAVVTEIPGTSSSVASKSEIEPINVQPEADDRKRKDREAIDETSEETKQGGSTTSTKRSRAAQVHNLSERKRRDRINERMKALQELIPRCNKSDKASMLDEAIEYMKSLQLQIQMMSIGCGMMPMMYPGMQQYMAMGMGMGMNQPLPPPPSFMPFPNMLPTQRPLPTQTHHMGGQHYPVHVHASDPSRVYVPNQQSDPTSSQPQYSGFTDPYQQFRSLHPTQPPQFQNQATSYPSSSRASSSKESEDQRNHTTG